MNSLNPYDGLPEQTSSVSSLGKRCRSSSTGSTNSVCEEELEQKDTEKEVPAPTLQSTSAAIPDGVQNKLEAPCDETLSSLEKLCTYLKVDSKFKKAVELTVKLVAVMDASNASSFYSCLLDVVSGKDLSRSECMDGCLQIFEALVHKQAQGQVQLTPPVQFVHDTLFILVFLQSSVVTDDSFDFAKTCGQLKAFVVKIPHIRKELVDLDESSYDSLLRARLSSILGCMRKAFKLYTTRQWAQPPLEQLFAEAAECRLVFPEELRDALDQLSNSMAVAQRKKTSWNGPTTVRTFNSTAHPMRSLKNDVLK